MTTTGYDQLEALWISNLAKYHSAGLSDRLLAQFPDDDNVKQLAYSYPPIFQPGYVGPDYFTSQKRILILAQNPGEGAANRSEDEKTERKFNSFAAKNLSFADLQFWLRSCILGWETYRDRGIFRESTATTLALLPSPKRPQISAIAILNGFPFKTCGNGKPKQSGQMMEFVTATHLLPNLAILKPDVLIHFPLAAGMLKKVAKQTGPIPTQEVFHTGRMNTNRHSYREKLEASWKAAATILPTQS